MPSPCVMSATGLSILGLRFLQRAAAQHGLCCSPWHRKWGGEQRAKPGDWIVDKRRRRPHSWSTRLKPRSSRICTRLTTIAKADPAPPTSIASNVALE